MSNKKRLRDDDATDTAENIHPSRKRRLEYGEADADLAKIFSNLRDENPRIRSEATTSLLRNLLAKSLEQQRKFDNAITRLVKGGCSGAKAARLGFSMALSEVLRLAFNKKSSDDGVSITVVGIVQKIIALSSPEGKVSGDEKRNYLLGRCFALQAILQSAVLQDSQEKDAQIVFDSIADLAVEKQWLRMECGAFLSTYLSDTTTPPKDTLVRLLIDSWASKGLVRSAEGVALWLLIKQNFPDVKLPKGYWHHNNPLASQERTTLTKVLFKSSSGDDEQTNGASKTSGARQSAPSFAWDIILASLYEHSSTQKFASFWSECVATPTFASSSSAERKALGLQVFSLALKKAPQGFLEEVVHPNIMRCIIDQRAKSDRLLFEATKLPLTQMASRAEEEPAVAADLACKLLKLLPGTVDKLTKTTLETIIGVAEPDCLNTIVSTISNLCHMPGDSIDDGEAEKKRRFLADILLQIIRARHNQVDGIVEASSTRLRGWLGAALCSMARLGCGHDTHAKNIPPLSESSRSMFGERLNSALSDLSSTSLPVALLASTTVMKDLRFDGKTLGLLTDDHRKVAKEAYKLLKNDIGDKPSATSQALQLLLAIGLLQVYQQEPDAIDVLEDILTCYQTPRDDEDSNAMLVELLLSFVSKQSALFRKTAEQVFSAFANEVGATGLQSMTEILLQKESLAGQNELFKNGDDGEEEDESGEDEDEDEEIDVEDMSDVDMTLLNGDVSDDDAALSEESSSEDSEVEDDDEDEDEDSATSEASGDEADDAELKRKAAGVLGTTGEKENENDDDDSSSDDGSEMDDEQMLEADKHLITFFREQRKVANKKQQGREAKANIVQFKNRVLDLLVIYVKSQYASPLALDLIMPLLNLIRTTGSPPTANKAAELLIRYFDLCKKNKAIPMPSEQERRDEDEAEEEAENGDDVFALLKDVHAEIRAGGSKVHAKACSRASLFLAKILVRMDEIEVEAVAGAGEIDGRVEDGEGTKEKNNKKKKGKKEKKKSVEKVQGRYWPRILSLYGELLTDWRADKNSKIQVSVLSDWNSWVLQR